MRPRTGSRYRMRPLVGMRAETGSLVSRSSPRHHAAAFSVSRVPLHLRPVFSVCQSHAFFVARHRHEPPSLPLHSFCHRTPPWRRRPSLYHLGPPWLRPPSLCRLALAWLHRRRCRARRAVSCRPPWAHRTAPRRPCGVGARKERNVGARLATAGPSQQRGDVGGSCPAARLRGARGRPSSAAARGHTFPGRWPLQVRQEMRP